MDDHFVSAATAGDGGDDEYADMSTFEEDNLVEADEVTGSTRRQHRDRVSIPGNIATRRSPYIHAGG